MKQVRSLTRLFVLIGLMASGLVMGGTVAAQDEEGFPLTAFAAYCEPEHPGPFVGCTPWAGVAVTFVAIDSDYSSTCVTESGDRAASCAVSVPFGLTIVASIDPATVPAGYFLQNPAVQELTIPGGPPEGVFGGPTFILLETVDTVEEPQVEPVPVEDEGEVYVPPAVVDGPQTDPEPGAITSLPSTGSGEPAVSPVMPLLLMGAASILAVGAYRLRPWSL